MPDPTLPCPLTESLANQLDPDQLAHLRDVARSLAPLTPDQQDALAEVLAQVDLRAAR